MRRITLLKADTPENREKYKRVARYVGMLADKTASLDDILKMISDENKQILEDKKKAEAAATAKVIISDEECKKLILGFLVTKPEDMVNYKKRYNYMPLEPFNACIDYIDFHRKTKNTETVFPELFKDGYFIERVVLDDTVHSTAVENDEDGVLGYPIKSTIVDKNMVGLGGVYQPDHLEFVKFAGLLYCVWADINNENVLDVSPQKASDYIKGAQKVTTVHEYIFAAAREKADEERERVLKEKQARDKEEIDRRAKEAVAAAERERLRKEAEKAKLAETDEDEDENKVVVAPPPAVIVTTAPKKDTTEEESNVKQDEDDEQTIVPEPAKEATLQIPWAIATIKDAEKYTPEQLVGVTNWDQVFLADRDVIVAFAKRMGVKNISNRFRVETLQSYINEYLKQHGVTKTKQVEPALIDTYFDENGEPIIAMFNKMPKADLNQFIADGLLEELWRVGLQDLSLSATSALAMYFKYKEMAPFYNFIPHDLLKALKLSLSKKEYEEKKTAEYESYIIVYVSLHPEFNKTGGFETITIPDEVELLPKNAEFGEILTKSGPDHASLDFRVMVHTPKWQSAILASEDAIDAIQQNDDLTQNWMTLAMAIGYTGKNYGYNKDEEDDVKMVLKKFIKTKVTFKSKAEKREEELQEQARRDKEAAEKKVQELQEQAKKAKATTKVLAKKTISIPSFWKDVVTRDEVRKVTADDIENASEIGLRQGLNAHHINNLNKAAVVALARKLGVDVDETEKMDIIKARLKKDLNIASQLSDIQSVLEKVERTVEFHADVNKLNIDMINDQLYQPLQEHLESEIAAKLPLDMDRVKLHLKLDKPLFSENYVDMNDYANQIRYLHTLSIVASMLDSGTVSKELVERCFVEWPPKVM